MAFNLEAITRDEKFKARAAGRTDVEELAAITRDEMFLADIAENAGGSGDAYTKEETDELLDGKADLVNGVVPISQIPPVVIERLVKVADDTARFALTTETVQNGDTVQTIDNNKMYAVIDDTHLDSEQGYQVYVAGMAARAVGDQNGNTIDTTYATKAMTKTAWMGTEAAYEALTSDDYDLYVIDEGVVSP